MSIKPYKTIATAPDGWRAVFIDYDDGGDPVGFIEEEIAVWALLSDDSVIGLISSDECLCDVENSDNFVGYIAPGRKPESHPQFVGHEKQIRRCRITKRRERAKKRKAAQ